MLVFIKAPDLVKGSVLDGRSVQTAERVPHYRIPTYAHAGLAKSPVYVYTQTELGEISPGQVVTAPLKPLRDALRLQKLKASPIAQGEGTFTVLIME